MGGNFGVNIDRTWRFFGSSLFGSQISVLSLSVIGVVTNMPFELAKLGSLNLLELSS